MAKVGTSTDQPMATPVTADDGAAAGRPDLLQPLDPARRIDVLDVARGFALLGILLMNIEFFARPLHGMMLGFDASLTGLDRTAGWLVAAFVQGKFWVLFSLLFGAGFALMLERPAAPGRGFGRLYARRLLVLLGIGLLHSVLLWAGDILVLYAVAGFLLLWLFRGTPVSRLWKWGLLLYAVPWLLTWLSAAALGLARVDPGAAAQMEDELARGAEALRASAQAAAQVYAAGDWREVTAQRWQDTRMVWSWYWGALPAVLGMFLLGGWLLRSDRLRNPDAHRTSFRRLFWIGLPVGGLLAIAAMQLMAGVDPMVPDARAAAAITVMGIASLLLALAYLSALVLAVRGPWPWLRDLLAPVGRLALSNYLLQSLVFSTLFYGYGGGWFGAVPRAWQVAMAIAFFLLQVLASHWWVRRFRYGPLEWLWRAASYGALPRMRA